MVVNPRPLVLPPGDTHFWHTYNYHQSALALALSESRGIAVDVGAHVGSVTRHLLLNYESVIAVEPRRELHPYIQQNVIRYLDRLVLSPFALSDRSGECAMHVAKQTNSGSGTMTEGTGTTIATLDDLVGDREVGFIKIDVQGHEYEVLKGAEATLITHKPTVWCEGPAGGPEESFLRSLGAVLGFRMGQDFVMGWTAQCKHAAFRSMP